MEIRAWYLCLAEETVTNAGFGKIENKLALRVGDKEAVFKLEATLWNDQAGIRDGRPVGRNDNFRIGNGLGMERNGSQENEREESEVEVDSRAHTQDRSADAQNSEGNGKEIAAELRESVHAT